VGEGERRKEKRTKTLEQNGKRSTDQTPAPGNLLTMEVNEWPSGDIIG